MNPPDLSTAPETGSAVLRFARCWADFTKALSIYPATNVRVRSTLESMLRTLAEARVAEGSAATVVLFRNDRLELGGVEHEEDVDGNLAWLRDRLDRAALAGVEFHEDLQAEPLVEFSKQLLRAYLQSAAHPSYEELWPAPYTGMVLVDRRFEGGFGHGPRVDGSANSEAPGGGGARANAKKTRAASGRRGGGELAGEDLVDILLGDGDVMVRLMRIRTLADQRAEPSDRGTASELLDRIVENLPAEALKDRESFLRAAHCVLEALEADAEAGHSGANSPIQDDKTLKALLHSVSHSHFARTGPDKTAWAKKPSEQKEDAAGPRKSRAGDDEVTDDVAGLLQEMEDLPPSDGLVLTRGEIERRGEELTVCMHYLTQMEEGILPESLLGTLARLLAAPGPDELEALRACVLADAGRRATAGESAGLTPIQSFLRSTGNAALLKDCNLFNASWLVQVFPRYFIPYLESVNPLVPDELATLDLICQELGPTRMIAAADAVQLEARLLESDVITRLLRDPTPARLPLARLCLTWFGQAAGPRVAVFLRTLDPPAPEAFLLYQFSDLSDLTVDYLFAMIDMELGKTNTRVVRDAVAGALCRHIRRLGNADPANTKRVESVRSLARFPSPTAQQMLRELTRGTWRPFSNREPAAIRRAARGVSKAYKKAA